MITSGDSYSLEPNLAASNSDSIAIIRKHVQENLRKSYERGKCRYNLRTRDISYRPGQIVWRKNFKLSDASKYISAKLCPRYIKCKVKRKIGTNSYELTDPNGRSAIFSTNVIKENPED